MEPFDSLLDWLDRDREAAGQKYETIRAGLVRIFISNGFCDAEDLADIAINRVVARLPDIKHDYVGEPAHYFLGVARNVIRESRRRKEITTDVLAVSAGEITDVSDEVECLRKCLKLLPRGQRDLAMEYYLYSGSEKIAHRKCLAEELGITLRALRVRAHRVRVTLQKCVLNCLKKSPSEMNDAPQHIIK